MSDSKKKFVIIDALALAYRAYFAFINRPLSNSKGEPTSAVYGFLTQLFKIIEDTSPDYLMVAFDSKEKTFRHEMYDLYKSSREAMPDDMIPQLQRLKDIVNAFNIPLLIEPGFEADDIIGAAVKLAEERGLESIAVTPDKDYVQLVTENIKIARPGKSQEEIEFIDVNKVREKYGFEPIQMIDYLALVGDSSDDIPGVAGVGPKTATPLLVEYGSVEGIYEHVEEIPKKGLKQKLIDNKENAFLSKKLATIVNEIPTKIDFEGGKFTDPNFDLLLEIFQELEFKNFGARLLKIYNKSNESEEFNTENDFEEQKSFSKDDVKYHLIKTTESAKELAAKLAKQKLFVFDLETDSLDVFDLNIAGIAFCYKPGEAYFAATNPANKSEGLFEINIDDRIPLDECLNIFREVFENESIKKVCQNGKYDLAVLRTYDINVKGFYFDTMLASYVIDPDQKHGMDALSEQHLNYKPIPISTLIGDKKDPSKIFDADLNQLSNYAAEDADITYRLYEKFKKTIKDEKLDKVSYDVEFPLVEVLEDMERTGVKIDVKALNNFSSLLKSKMELFTTEIYKIAGEEFNVNSTKQLQTILFDKLKLTPTKKTKTGYSTDARALEAMRGENDIVDLLLEYRQVSKLKSTYSDSLPKLIHHKTGRVHTSYNQTVASTGRLSSIDPNLQNIPIRTDLGKEIRKAFVPTDKNHVIFSADYSQIELRIMASICKDPGLTKAFKEGEDIHRSTAALVFQVDPEEVTSDMRRRAKEVNFGILYGIGAFGLKTRLGITQSLAKEIIDNYFATFTNVKKFMDDSVKFAKENGYAETLIGRRRFLKNINSNNRVVRQFEERVAINMPIQGTAADMIKLAMIKVHNLLKRKNVKTKMILQVHDELVFDMHKDEVDDLKPQIIKIMEEAFPLNVPVKVDSGTGKNWLEAH
jgi:DNA polymerase-1